MCGWITKKYTSCRTRSELVAGYGGEVGVVEAPEDMKSIGGWLVVDESIGDGIANDGT